jgi:hypothetical protein
MTLPRYQVRGRHTDSTITVYQAYPPRIGLPAARDVHAHVRAGDLDAARGLLPTERPYPAPDALLSHLRP